MPRTTSKAERTKKVKATAPAAVPAGEVLTLAEAAAYLRLPEAEVLRGRFDSLLKAADGEQLLRAQHWLHLTEQRLAQIVTVPFDATAADEFDRLRADRRLRKIGRADLLIASIALARRATLVTRN